MLIHKFAETTRFKVDITNKDRIIRRFKQGHVFLERCKTTVSNVICNSYRQVAYSVYLPAGRDCPKFALGKLAVSERIEVNEPRLKNSLSHLL